MYKYLFVGLRFDHSGQKYFFPLPHFVLHAVSLKVSIMPLTSAYMYLYHELCRLMNLVNRIASKSEENITVLAY